MRKLRWVLFVAVVVGALTEPTVARADGGAYVEFDHTFFLPGQSAEGYAQVYIPAAKQAILDRGPFFAYLLTRGTPIREGHPLPAGTVSLGAFSIHRVKSEWYRFEVRFTVPNVVGDFYTVMTCNSPCTVTGFREPLTGVLSIVGTPREARLLIRQGKLQAQVGSLHREIKKSERSNQDLHAALAANRDETTVLTLETSRLRHEIAALEAAHTSRPLLGGAAAWLLAVGLALLGLAVGLRRRRSRPHVLVHEERSDGRRELEPSQPR